MRLSLPLRIFLAHLVFAVGVAALAVFLVRDSFQRYRNRWEQEVQTLPAETLFQPFANEIARSLLLRIEQGPAEEVQERDRARVSEGLNILLRELPSILSVVIVDRDGRIQYASESQVVDLGFTGDDDASFFASSEIVRRRKTTGEGELLTELLVPIYDNPGPGAAAGERRRLGSLRVHYLPDPALTARVPGLQPPSIETRRFVLPVVLFLAAVAVSGIFIAALTGLPVRRLDRALRDFRARGFRGGLEIDRRGLQREFASAVSAINEMGGRLEALDARGREREALLGTLAQSLEEGMLALDPRRDPVAWNRAALRILTPGSRQLSRPDAHDEGSEKDLLLGSMRLNPGLVDHGPEHRLGRKRELEVVRADASRVPVRVTQVPFEARPGQEGTLLLLRDLATLSKVEAHLLEAGRFAVLAHLAAGLAHEIRNPLHAIGINAGVVEQYVGVDPTPPQRKAMSESLNTIKDETRRLSDLLNNYLGLVRSESIVGPVDVPELCRRVQQLLAYSAAQSDVEIRILGGQDVPPVEGVAARLQQAILNLVLNSIQAMPRGGVVSLETGFRDGHVQLAVEDTGPGLSHEQEEALFDMRMTTKPEGTGLGLPLVRLIAEVHGGEVAYRARPGGGAAFILRLPTRAVA